MGEKSTKYVILAFTAAMIIFSLFVLYFIYDFRQKREESFYNTKKKELQNLINLYIKTEYERNLLLAKSLASNTLIVKMLKEGGKRLEPSSLEELDKLVRVFDEIKSNEIWFQLLSKDFISLYRSWDKKVGDDVSFRKELKVIKNSPKPMQLISVGRYSVAYKNIFPIVSDNELIGYTEIIVPLQRTSKMLHANEGLEIALFIDKEYGIQLDRAISPKFINGYNLVYESSDTFEQILKSVNFANLAKSNEYQKVGGRVVASVPVLDIDGKNMAYFVAQKELEIFDKELEKEISFISLLQFLTIVVTVVLVVYFLWYLYALKREMELIKALNEELIQKIEQGREKIRAQEETLFRQKRDSSIRELMLNLAHQWRQPLNVVAIKLQSVDDIQDVPQELKERLSNIINDALKEIFELSEIISKFTSFYASKDKGDTFKLVKSVKQAVELYSEVLKSFNIKVKFYVQEDLEIRGSQKEMTEIFLEFLQNIEDVVKSRSLEGAHITISADKKDGMAVVTIEDDAGGVEEKILDTIFDPYSTTSFKERKKGLGMSLVRRTIEERYKGSISVENTKEGARFEMLLYSA